mmetsp:Transcript_18525/g.63134  ORF Transcript_18525/g.63134 Transcript_18525/m.63134 type:complete len:238 (+) Transcript_18525:570-1283(+)
MMRRGRRRMTASSRSNGLLVAASTSTRSLSRVRRPSQLDMNSFFILRIASCSPGFSRLPSIESTSSTNTTVGSIFDARVKTALTHFSPSPNHLDAMALMLMLMKCAPASVATAFASMVFPVPGGPNRRMPLHGRASAPRRKSSGRCSGSITSSRREDFTGSSAPMSSKRTPTSSGGMISLMMRRSNSLSVCKSLSWRFEDGASACMARSSLMPLSKDSFESLIFSLPASCSCSSSAK